jgi:diguanylate cyclase (GGDEF)-like protein
MALASLAPPLRYPLTLVLNLGVVVMALMTTAAAIACAVRGFRPAYYFLLAWGLLIAGGVALPMSSFGMLPRTLVTEYGIQFGSAAEMILLSFSLAYRISLLRAEKEQVVLSAKLELEQRVQERTRELAEVASSLARANAQLAEASRRDGLTGLFNRRHLDQALDAAWADWRERGRRLALVMLDIDRFKSINDQHGHAVGDDCLREVASRCRDLPLGYSLIARYGGEEFVLVLQDESAATAMAFAEHLRHRIADHPVATFKGPLVVTISLGVALARPDHTDPASLLREADEALYAAKKAGRNRVVAR